MDEAEQFGMEHLTGENDPAMFRINKCFLP